MFELLSGYSPFVAKNNQDLYQNIRRLKIQWPKDMPPLAKNLIGKILKLNTLDRPSLQEKLDHQWFKQTKIIKPLLENNSTKDLLVYHMLSEPNEEILNIINKLLKLTGKDADNTNAKNITKETLDSDHVIQKKNIMKQIEVENKNKNELININEIDTNEKQEKKEKNENKINETPTPSDKIMSEETRKKIIKDIIHINQQYINR